MDGQARKAAGELWDKRINGATGRSDIEGPSRTGVAARVAASECGQGAGFKGRSRTEGGDQRTEVGDQKSENSSESKN